MDYSFFDGLIDSVFVINSDRGIVYCNEAAATLCGSSVKRLVRGKPIYETIEFSDSNLFTMPNGTAGKSEPSPYEEIHYKLKSGKAGKVQVAIQPFVDGTGESLWAVMVRDVTLEEVLHAKYHKQLEEKEIYIQQLQEAQKQLENYSKNLERMVEERTLEVKRANKMLSAIMNSLGQGFLVFDQKGICSDVYTKACEDVLEIIPAQRKINDVLKIESNDIETFEMWKTALFVEKLPFESLKDLGPNRFHHSQDRYVRLDYFPLRNENKSIENIVVVATDLTSEYKANKALEKEKRFAKMLLKLVGSRKQFGQFLESVKGTCGELKSEIEKLDRPIDHELIFRVLHTLEGEAASYSVDEIWASARETQEVLEPLKRGESINIQEVRANLLSGLMKIEKSYSDFLAKNANLFDLIGIDRSNKIEIDVPRVVSILDLLEKRGVAASVVTEIEGQLLREPIGSGFTHFQDVVASVAEKLGKEVAPIEYSGMETRVFIENYQLLLSSLVHAFRNAVDHGIEAPADREMIGKSRTGHIWVAVDVLPGSPNWIRISISDDGNGVSLEKLREKVVEKYGKSKLNGMSDMDIMGFVFESGVTTKDQIGEYSGRGIGMNAIKAEAERLGGRVRFQSQVGAGSKLIIEIPDQPRVAYKLQVA